MRDTIEIFVSYTVFNDNSNTKSKILNIAPPLRGSLDETIEETIFGKINGGGTVLKGRTTI